MPVGFENSALKMSFSLSSLQSGGGQGSPQQARMQAERPYNSLTKKTKETAEREMWRRSWGTQEEKKDEFWAALQTNYNYLMDNNLIESCKEANGELSCDEEDATLLSKWSFKDFTAQFSELCSWLDDIREAIYGKEENLRDRNLRLEHVGAMQRNAYKRKLFTEQARRLLLEHSELQDEVTWRVNHLNSKWEMLEQFISPSKMDSSQRNFCADVEHEADCLKEWIREMEQRLKPLNMQIVNNWNNQELVEKITEHEVLHQDIKAHGKVVSAVLRRAELAEAIASVQLAQRLERRWHLLFLRVLEWQFHLEYLLKLRKHPPQEHLYSESDEEPLSKHPRLSSADCSDQQTDDGSYFEDDIKDFWVPGRKTSDTSAQVDSSHLRKDSCATVVQSKDADVISDSENQKPISSKDTKENSSDKLRNNLLEVTTFDIESSVSNIGSRSTESNEKATNTYFKKTCLQHNLDSVQMDLIESVPGPSESVLNKVSEGKIVEDSSDEEWTYTSGRRTVISRQKEHSYSLKPFLFTQKRSVATRLDFGESIDKISRKEGDNCPVRDRVDASIGSDQALSSFSNETQSFPSSLENTKESIQLLVRQAELLVREDSLACGGDPLLPGSEAKQARIKQWVKMHSPMTEQHQPPDSCDASGEYTTGDSDEECCTEYLEDSSGMLLVNKHLDALMDSRPGFLPSESPKDPKVTLRREKDSDVKDTGKGAGNKQGNKRERPWSVSGISQLTAVCQKDDASYLANFSTSESALHQITSECTTVMKNREYSTVSSKDNLSSSTVHDTSCNNSLQRRKGRHRKKHPTNTSAKIESPNDSANLPLTSENVLLSPKHQTVSRTVLEMPISETQEMDESQKHLETKVRTVSETTCTSVTTEINSISDSSILLTESNSSKVEDGTVESDNEVPADTVLPVFRLGPEKGAITPLDPKVCLDPHVHLECGVDSDMDRISGLQNTDEHLSSSEQAWDSYQEKYLSEPYSEEIADSEEARRLLEFGDDYHNFLDSVSDCASSVEFFQRISPMRKRKSIVAVGDSSVLDSDSDIEDIHHLIKQSKSHLSFTEQVLYKHVSKISSEIWLTDYEEIVATCKENKRCLRVILENVKEGDILTFKERKEIEELLSGWDSLQIHADELQSVSSLQQKLNSLRKMLLDTTTRINSLVENLNDLTSLDSIIEILKEEMQSLLEFKDQLYHLNVAVHELVTEPVDHDRTISSVMPVLKEDVTELYRIWSNSFESVSTRLLQLEKAVETWHRFDKEMSDLQMTLEGDHGTLLLLRKSLDEGDSSIEDVALSIRDIARALSEVPGSRMDNSSQVDQNEGCSGMREGSLSDSGISDAGSEHELYVRARRLASLRELAQNLQSELGTSEGVVTQINERIDNLDHELHHLQEVCRKLIVRTKFWMEKPRTENVSYIEEEEEQLVETLDDVQPEAMACEECNEADSRTTQTFPWDHMAFVATNAQNLKSGRSNKKHSRSMWIWRVLRTAFPLQLSLLSLLCLACVFEPHCCESVNNLSFSLTPQLRYVYGPPPV